MNLSHQTLVSSCRARCGEHVLFRLFKDDVRWIS